MLPETHLPEPVSLPTSAQATVPPARIAAVAPAETRRTNPLFLENTNTLNKTILVGVTTALAVGAAFFLTRNVSSASAIRYMAVAALLAGCGARTGLEIPEERDNHPVYDCTLYDTTSAAFTDLHFSPLENFPINVGGSEGQYALLGVSNNFNVYNLNTGESTRLNFEFDNGFLWIGATFSDDGHSLVVSSGARSHEQVYIYDLSDPRNIRRSLISQNNSGEPGNGASLTGHISADGNKIIYVSNSTNLTADNNTLGGIFIYNRPSNSLRKLNTPNLIVSSEERISINAEGSRVVFTAQDQDSRRIQIYIYDLNNSRLIDASTNLNTNDFDPYMSGDGHRVVFTHSSALLSYNSIGTVYLWEEGRGFRALTRLSTVFNQGSRALGFSRDGNRILLESNDSSLAPRVHGPGREILLMDLNLNRTVLITEDACDHARQLAGVPVLAADGRSGVSYFIDERLVPSSVQRFNADFFFNH